MFVSDQGNSRIVEFSAWGSFVKAWGWGVVDGSEELQVCTVAAQCEPGSRGSRAGELGGPQGIAVDSNGDVYISEFANRRVQKFDSEGNFVLMFGGDVNLTKVEEGAGEAARNLCTAASGDVCKKGMPGTGDGQFGDQVVASFIAVGPGDRIYVGDRGRIQVFDSDGTYNEDFPDPEGVLAEGTVQSLARAPVGGVFVALSGGAGVLRLNASGSQVCEAKAKEPTAIGSDAAGALYVVDATAPIQVRQFSPGCADREEAFGVGELNDSTGLAVGSACMSKGAGVYVSNTNPGFLRAYGPAPDKLELCEKPVKPPDLISQYATSVDTEGAIVRAEVNPRFWSDTSYYVEYGTSPCVSGGWKSSCIERYPSPPGSMLGTAEVDVPLTSGAVFLRGLEPGTEYRYRFVAESSGGGPVFGTGGETGKEGADARFRTFAPRRRPSTVCPNAQLRSGPSANLPDCRAYEMVSPIDKGGAGIHAFETSIFRSSSLHRTALSGNRFTYSAYRSFGDAQSAPLTSQYLASRNPASGWSTEGISPPRGTPTGSLGGAGEDNEFKTFSADLCLAWLIRENTSAPPLVADAVNGFVNLYRRSNCGESAGRYHALTTVSPPNRGALRLELQGVSDDGERAVFAANDSLVPGVPDPGNFGKLVYESFGDVLPQPRQMACVLPGGSPAAQCTAGTAGNPAGFNIDGRTNIVTHAVSDDGSRIYWSDLARFPGAIYVRVDGERTVAVSEAAGGGRAQFWAASDDGDRAIFSIGSPATGAVMSAALYEFDLNAALAGEAEAATLIANEVAGVVGTSDDGSRVYLIARDVLDSAPNSKDAKALAGAPNLYLYDSTARSFSFIATLTESDAIAKTGFGHELTLVNVEPFKHSARVSPDGGGVAFMAVGSPTGYDNTDLQSGEADAEVFRYQADADQLSCVSCNPSGARPVGRNISPVGPEYWAAARIPNPESQLYASRALSDDGRRLFFESFEALVLGDTNKRQDVYQWEAPGKGDCTIRNPAYSPPNDGCLSLISSGESTHDSYFLDATPSGNDVFIRTGARLVQSDPGLFDIYDARVGGGFAEPLEPSPCEGDACQGPAAAPEAPSPASSAFDGPGNLAAPSRCARAARQVKRLSQRARRLRRAAHRARSPRRAQALRKRARRRAGQAKRRSRAAQRCRRRAGR